jgi:hypothetical protein
LRVPNVTFEADDCPGLTANGLKGVTICRVKSPPWANAEGSRASSAHTAQRAARAIRNLRMDGENSDFNMSRFRFK